MLLISLVKAQTKYAITSSSFIHPFGMAGSALSLCDSVRAPVSRYSDRAGTLSDGIRVPPGDVNDLVELEMDAAKPWSDQVQCACLVTSDRSTRSTTAERKAFPVTARSRSDSALLIAIFAPLLGRAD
jgi:hypothetical protein